MYFEVLCGVFKKNKANLYMLIWNDCPRVETASVKPEKGYETDLFQEQDRHRKKTFFTVCFLNIDLEKSPVNI